MQLSSAPRVMILGCWRAPTSETCMLSWLAEIIARLLVRHLEREKEYYMSVRSLEACTLRTSNKPIDQRPHLSVVPVGVQRFWFQSLLTTLYRLQSLLTTLYRRKWIAGADRLITYLAVFVISFGYPHLPSLKQHPKYNHVRLGIWGTVTVAQFSHLSIGYKSVYSNYLFLRICWIELNSATFSAYRNLDPTRNVYKKCHSVQK